MNKIASMSYLIEQNIPTSGFYIINKKSLEENIFSIFYKAALGWVIRCGRNPSIKEKPEKGLPWHVCSSVDEMIETVRDFYRELPDDYYVFIHPQREMIKSGNMLVIGKEIIIETVAGWPEGLSHGTQGPQATYFFKAPSLFIEPAKIEGDESMLLPEELLSIGRNIERRLDYSAISSLANPVTIEFSINKNRKPNAHDIR
jgi:hypothetical protein